MKVSDSTVRHVAHLATIPVSDEEVSALAHSFAETLDVIENLKELDVSKTSPTHQVTGMENITRPDVIIPERSFTQQQALANAKHTHKGYFVVPVLVQKAA